MKFKNILKESLISLAVLTMVGGSINPANAKHRRYHYRTHRRTKRNVNKYGYWRKYRRHGRSHYYWYKYKTGYFHRGHWIKRKSVKKVKPLTFKWNGKRISAKKYIHNLYEFAKQNKKHRKHVNHAYKYNDGFTRRQNIHLFGTPNPSKNVVKSSVGTAHPSKAQRNNYINNNANSASNNAQNDSADNDVNQNLTEMKSQTLTDINKDRQANGLAPLTESQELDNIANMRAQQLKVDPDDHKDPSTGVNYYAEDAQQLGYSNIPNKSLSENITEKGIDTETNEDGHTYTSNNGIDMANNAENNMMNYDAHSDWGHRENILDPTNTVVGVGTSYANGTYNLAEDFTGPDYASNVQ